MINKRAISSIVIILFCILLFVFVRKTSIINNSIPEANVVFSEDKQEEDINVFMVDINNISEFSLNLSEGVSVGFYKDDDTWYLEDDSTLSLNQDVIKEILTKLCLIRADYIVKDADVSEYGLDEPKINYELKIDDANILISLGNSDEDGNIYFLMNNDESLIYRGDSSLLEPSNYSLSDILLFD